MNMNEQARCRVYDGVVCGKDITKWLLTSTYKYALDYTEAHRIAQGLLEADLLTPVCAGYDHTLQLTPRDSGISRSTAAGGETAAGAGAVSCSQNIVTDRETLATFKSHPSYIYRYPGRSGPSGGIGAFSMFAHRVVTSIPSWFQADAEDTSASSITNYTVRSCLLDEQWEVFRRWVMVANSHCKQCRLLGFACEVSLLLCTHFFLCTCMCFLYVLIFPHFL